MTTHQNFLTTQHKNDLYEEDEETLQQQKILFGSQKMNEKENKIKFNSIVAGKINEIVITKIEKDDHYDMNFITSMIKDAKLSKIQPPNTTLTHQNTSPVKDKEKSKLNDDCLQDNKQEQQQLQQQKVINITPGDDIQNDQKNDNIQKKQDSQQHEEDQKLDQNQHQQLQDQDQNFTINNHTQQQFLNDDQQDKDKFQDIVDDNIQKNDQSIDSKLNVKEDKETLQNEQNDNQNQIINDQDLKQFNSNIKDGDFNLKSPLQPQKLILAEDIIVQEKSQPEKRNNQAELQEYTVDNSDNNQQTKQEEKQLEQDQNLEKKSNDGQNLQQENKNENEKEKEATVQEQVDQNIQNTNIQNIQIVDLEQQKQVQQPNQQQKLNDNTSLLLQLKLGLLIFIIVTFLASIFSTVIQIQQVVANPTYKDDAKFFGQKNILYQQELFKDQDTSYDIIDVSNEIALHIGEQYITHLDFIYFMFTAVFVELISILLVQVMKIQNSNKLVFFLQIFLTLKDIATMVMCIIQVDNSVWFDNKGTSNSFVQYGYFGIRSFFNLFFILPLINIQYRRAPLIIMFAREQNDKNNNKAFNIFGDIFLIYQKLFIFMIGFLALLIAPFLIVGICFYFQVLFMFALFICFGNIFCYLLLNKDKQRNTTILYFLIIVNLMVFQTVAIVGCLWINGNNYTNISEYLFISPMNMQINFFSNNENDVQYSIFRWLLAL